MLTAVVLDGYTDAVVKALLEEGVMDFVHLSDFQNEQVRKLANRSPEVPFAAISDLRVRCENLMRQGGINIPSIEKNDVDRVSELNVDEIRKYLDRLSSSLSSLRDGQMEINQKLLSCDELINYIREKKMDYLDLRVGTLASADKKADFMTRLSTFGGILADDGKGHLISLTLKRDSSRVDDAFDKFGWTESAKEPKDCLEIVLRQALARKAEIEKQNADIVSQVESRIKEKQSELEKIWITLRVSELSEHVESFFSYTRNTTLFSGWVPSSKAESVEATIYEAAKGKCIIEWTEDTEVDRSKIPTSVSSASVLAPFERMVKNYGTPEYGSINPTPFTTIAYIIMFMLMFADVGQGFILLLIGIIGKAYYRKNPLAKDGMISRYLCSLLMFLGPASMFGGVLFGSYFGYSLLPALWFDYHAVVNGHAEGGLVSSVYDILGITIKFGIAVIFTGLVLNWINLFRKKRYLELVFDKNGLVGGVIYALGIFAC